MSKAPVDIIKYIIHAEAEANGLVEKPDLIGAIFGQTEGLLGEELDLRELQKSGRIGRIDADIETKGGVTKAHVTIPSSLDMVETSIVAAGVETITRIGPCDAKFRIKQIEDIREAKRKQVVERARDILKNFMSAELPDSREISEGLREDIRTEHITSLQGLDAGPAVMSSESIIIVEGRADVLNLLRNGIKNSIAVGGIKIPKEIVGISQNKETTVFVDGDRGGDLILKSLRNAGARIDFVARAPAGREVEGLARKEIIMALRRKKPANEIFAELDSKGEDSKPTEIRIGSGETQGYGDYLEGRGNRRERDRRDRRGRDRRDRRSGDQRDRFFEGDRAPRERPAISEPPRSAESDKLLEILRSIKNQAIILDDKVEVVKKVDLDKLKKEKALRKAHALVIDDIITKEVLALAENCKYIAGITTAGNLNVPKDKIILTKF